MTRPTSLDQVERSFRRQLCATCPYRTPGQDHRGCEQVRPCEETCELFHLLPALYETGRHLEPMVGRRHQVLTEMLEKARKASRGGPLNVRDHSAQTVRIIEQTFYPHRAVPS